MFQFVALQATGTRYCSADGIAGSRSLWAVLHLSTIVLRRFLLLFLRFSGRRGPWTPPFHIRCVPSSVVFRPRFGRSLSDCARDSNHLAGPLSSKELMEILFKWYSHAIDVFGPARCSTPHLNTSSFQQFPKLAVALIIITRQQQFICHLLRVRSV